MFQRRKRILVPNVRISIREGDNGPLIRTIEAHNLVTGSGLDKVRNGIGYPNAKNEIPFAWGKTPNYIAIGTGAVAPEHGNTVLGAEVLRKIITRRYPQDHGIDFYLYLSTAEANGNTLTEAGLFTEAAGGTLWARAIHAAIVKTALVSVSYRWTWTFGVPA